jgi:O-antigen ligase
VQSDLARFGEWCVLAGVFLLVTGDGLTTFGEPVPSAAWPWLYLVAFGVSLPVLMVSGRIDLRRPPRTAILYPPLTALLAAFALSTMFSPERTLSLTSLGCAAAIAAFCWYFTHLFEDERLADGVWIVTAVGMLYLAARVIAWRIAEGVDRIPLHIPTVAWDGKLQLTWVCNLFAPFLFARFIGEQRRWASWLNGAAWIGVGAANYLLLSRMGALVFAVTTIVVCLANLGYWRRWAWLMGVAAVGGGVLIATHLNAFAFITSTFLDRSQNLGINLRLRAWDEAWQMFLTHPIAGIGVGTFDEVAYQMPGSHNPDFYRAGWHAHNALLHVLAEAGVLGLAAWIFLWFVIVRALLRARRTGDPGQRLFNSAALTFVAAFQILSMTEVLIAARVHASLRMNLAIALLVIGGLRMSLQPRTSGG